VPANLTNVVALVAAPPLQSLGLKADGAVVAWGTATNVPAGLSNVVAIAADEGYGLALLGSGQPYLPEAPISRAVAMGETTSFRVAATGARPLSYSGSLKEPICPVRPMRF
jgi:hypothetical protein